MNALANRPHNRSRARLPDLALAPLHGGKLEMCGFFWEGGVTYIW